METEGEGSAITWARLGTDKPTMASKNAINDCEADPGAFKFTIRMQSLKQLKQVFREIHVKAGTVIPYSVGRLPVFQNPCLFRTLE